MVVRHQWPKEGVSRIPYWVYTDPEIYAREQERIFCGQLLGLCRARSGDPDSRRLQAHVHRRQAGRGGARRSRRRQRGREPLRASRRAVLPDAPRPCHRVHVPLPPVDLQPAGRPHRRAVPPRRQAAGGHARRLRSDSSTAYASCKSPDAMASCSPRSQTTSSRSRTISAWTCSNSSIACSMAASSRCWATRGSSSRRTGS